MHKRRPFKNFPFPLQYIQHNTIQSKHFQQEKKQLILRKLIYADKRSGPMLRSDICHPNNRFSLYLVPPPPISHPQIVTESKRTLDERAPCLHLLC